MKTPDDKPEAEERHCYCGLWRKNPRVLERQGIPRGYCGLCQVCGKPGHTRHFPGAVPYTGSWCDRHYQMNRILHPMGAVGFYLWAAAIGGAVILWWILS